MTFYNLLEGRLKARFGVIWVQTSDLRRAYSQFKEVAYENDYNLYKWTCVEGLMELGLTMDTVLSIGDHVKDARQILTEVLRRMDEYDNEIFVLEGFQDFIHYADVKALIQKLAQEMPRTQRPKHIVLLSPRVLIPEELARFIDVLVLPEPTEQEYITMLVEESKAQGGKVEFERIAGLVAAVKGLTELEARGIFRLVGVETEFGEGAQEVASRERTRIDEKMTELGLEE